MTERRRALLTAALDVCALFLLTAVLIKPIFKLEYLETWPPEGKVLADARLLNQHWPGVHWQPLWDGGLRVDHAFPPAPRYGAVAISRSMWVSLARAWHVYQGLFYCFGIAGVYVLARLLGSSRGAAWLAATGTALVSPASLFLEKVQNDASLWVPHRLGAMLRYGEGAHMASLALIAPALGFAYRALRSYRPFETAIAAVLGSAALLNSRYSTVTFVVLFFMLAWSAYITSTDANVWKRAGVVGALTYGLIAFWATPSYILALLPNLTFAPVEGSMWSIWIAMAVLVSYILLTNRWARGRRELVFPVFACGGALMFATVVLGHSFVNLRIVPKPALLIAELDLLLILASVAGLVRLPRGLAAVIVIVSLGTSIWYVRSAWQLYPADPAFSQRVEYRVQDWVAKNMPAARVMVTGSVEQWFDTWNNLSHLSGGNPSNRSNDAVRRGEWQVARGSNAEAAQLWLQILAADAVLVTGAGSDANSPAIAHPERFSSLPIVYDDGHDNVLRAVPRRWRSLARVVHGAGADSLRPVDPADDVSALRAYADVLERGPEAPTTTRWESPEALRINARVGAAQSVIVSVNYDRAWQAYSGTARLPVREAPLGFVRIEAPRGDHEIRLLFVPRLGKYVGAVLTLLSAAVVIVLLLAGLRGRGEPA